MAFSIKDPGTDRLARALADATGESITEAIRRALEERLARETQRHTRYRLETSVRRVQEQPAKLPVLDAVRPTTCSAMTNMAFRADHAWSSIRPRWSRSC